MSEPTKEGLPANKSNPTGETKTQIPSPPQPTPQGDHRPPGDQRSHAARIPSIEVQNREMSDPDLMGLDVKSLDPNRAYRWVRVEQSGRPVLRKKLKGWQIETIREGGPRPLVNLEKRGDNAIVVGDGILMSRPRILHEQRMKLQAARTEELLNSTTAMVEAEADAKGLSLIKDPDHLKSRDPRPSIGESP